MGLIRRIGRIIRSNTNALLDRCEDPELLLDQAIRDMEAALHSALAGAAKVVAHERLLDRQRTAAEREVAECRRHAEAAVRAGNDGDARQALRRQHDLSQLAATLTDQGAEAAAASRKLRRQIEKLRQRLLSARRERDLLIARQRAAEARRHLFGVLSDAPADLEGAQEFSRMAHRIQVAEAETDALAELSSNIWLDDDALEKETDAWVERALQALKASP